LKVYLITPVDLKYSYRATEEHVYSYAKYLKEHGIDAEILITRKGERQQTLLPNYKEVIKLYDNIAKKHVRCKEIVLPLKWHIFIYKDLPKGGTIYFPYGIYDYLFNILFKPEGQKYVIGSHSMHLKMGHMLKNHEKIEWLLNFIVKSILFLRRKEKDDIYFHVINSMQEAYLIKNFKINKKNIFYVPNFIDTSKYSLAKNSSKKLRVVHIGGMEKDASTVFDIVKLLKEKRVLDRFEFYFIGKLNKQIEEQYGSLKNVHILGQIDDCAKLKALSSADCMIIPSYEAFPKTLLEGLLSGLYILTSKRNSVWQDFIDFGIRMFVAENGFSEEYLQAIMNLSEKKSKGTNINPYREFNRNTIIKNFDKGNVLTQIFKMFKTVEK
jgi:glycosyltransferase involved in cell wall biosynthesis